MKNGLEVFEFKEEDELPELAAGKFLSKLKNPSTDGPPILKYEFLDRVVQGSDVPKQDIGILPCVDVDAVECDQSVENVISDTPPLMLRDNIGTEEKNCGTDDITQSSCTCHEQESYSNINNQHAKGSITKLEARVSCCEVPSPGKNQLNHAFSDCPSSSEPVDNQIDADESMNKSSPSSHVPGIAEGDVILDGHNLDQCSSDPKMDHVNIAVDYVVYRNDYCSGCLVTFSSSGIKIEGLTSYDNQGTLSFERGIDDIVQIESQHLHRLETVIVKFHILSKGEVQADDACGTSGVEELDFAVVEPNWSGMWEQITSLNVKYLAVWCAVNDTDDAMVEGDDLFKQRRYFPNFDEAFEDVVYPKGDSDAVSISRRDVDLLQPETFINDTIIDFYIKYLKNQIPPEEKHRFHFFNSFFFRKLADLDKDPSSAADGRAAFLRVHKWTRKVDIFGKDYVFIPVNFNLHWSLLVMCHPGELVGFEDEDSMKSLRVPCVLHMDSIKGTHAGLKNLVQSYLWEEWKERHKDTAEGLSSKFLNLRFVPLELPQQENSYDCGLFLLHYLELFLVESPVNFTPFKLNEFSKFLTVDWFPPSEASLKRTLIMRLISELLEKHSRGGDLGDEPQSDSSNDGEKETRLEFVSGRCSPAVSCHGNASNCEAVQGIEITLLETSCTRNSECVNDPGLVLREFFEPGVGAQCSSFDQPSSFYRLNCAMPQIEDGAETEEQLLYFPSGETVFQQIGGIMPQAGSVPYTYRGFEGDPTWNRGLSIHGEDDSSSSEPSICESSDSDIGIIENGQNDEDGVLCGKESISQQRSLSAENMECLTETLASASSEMLVTPTIEGTTGPDEMHHSNENGNLNPCQDAATISFSEIPCTEEKGAPEVSENVNVNGKDVQATDNDLMTESDEMQAAKRRRLTLSLEDEEVTLEACQRISPCNLV